MSSPYIQVVDNVTAHAFTKADFITYYESTVTGRPVRWFFHASSGQPAQFDVMTWEDGGKAAEAEWQAPAYCFTGNGGGTAQGGERPMFDVPEIHRMSQQQVL